MTVKRLFFPLLAASSLKEVVEVSCDQSVKTEHVDRHHLSVQWNLYIFSLSELESANKLLKYQCSHHTDLRKDSLVTPKFKLARLNVPHHVSEACI